MKLSEYIKHLQRLENDFDLGDADVVYASDDEGNDFQLVACLPSLGQFNAAERVFRSESDEEINAVCVN